MSQSPSFSRRKLLAGIGTTGLVLGGVGFHGELSKEPPFTRYTYAQTAGGDRLRVAWYETYNGAYQESQGNTDATNWNDEELFVSREPEEFGPIVALNDVLPGDRGTVGIGFYADTPNSGEGLHVWFKPTLTRDDDVWVNEPERKAGDDPEDSNDDFDGELAAATTVKVWHDTGVLDNGAVVGVCNGQYDFGEPAIASGDLTTLELVGDYGGGPINLRGNDAWTLLDFARGDPDSECLASETKQCIVVEWELPGDVGNKVQSDAVGFDLAFAATACSYRDEDGNPRPPSTEEVS